ncbi:Crp/Fnr family transcriptional regulator [Neosynechococcus sphagnicola]|uniref:Crp/Fnr family transcriptional regulator n=1 Tax=Neosynechococcus sphagnicola TaxID=1501145 RepID=UPI00055E05BC|nr:cyclic nucleotide-binding domain-containing protein [Neosynechococcus sphagnicola]
MLKQAERIEFLLNLPLFQDLDSPEFLRRLAVAMEEVTFAAEEPILAQGARGDLLYLIVSGSVQIHIGTTVLEQLNPSDFFGELPLFSPDPPQIAIRAQTPTHCLTLSQLQLYGAIDVAPTIALGIIRVLCQRIHRLNQVIASLAGA